METGVNTHQAMAPLPVDLGHQLGADGGQGGALGDDMDDIVEAVTVKIPGEGTVREWPDELVMSDAVKEQVTRRWAEFGLE